MNKTLNGKIEEQINFIQTEHEMKIDFYRNLNIFHVDVKLNRGSVAVYI